MPPSRNERFVLYSAESILLVQGTLYSDPIESGRGVGSHAVTIKSHHNVARPLVRAKRETGRVLEPFGVLYDADVRDGGLYDEIGRASAVLLPIRSVGGVGDSRAYGDVVAPRAVVSRDGTTSDVYGKPPATIELE